APSGMADMHGVLEVEMGGHRREIVGIVIHVMAAAALARAAVAAAVRGDDAEALGQEEQQLCIPGLRRKRPAMPADDRLSRTPVLVEYLGTVFGGDRGHGAPTSLTEILHRYSIIRVSCARPRYVRLAFDIRPISRMVEEVRPH